MTTYTFISLLRDTPWIGMIIGLVFFAMMFGIKNMIVYLYSRNQEKSGNLPE